MSLFYELKKKKIKKRKKRVKLISQETLYNWTQKFQGFNNFNLEKKQHSSEMKISFKYFNLSPQKNLWDRIEIQIHHVIFQIEGEQTEVNGQGWKKHYSENFRSSHLPGSPCLLIFKMRHLIRKCTLTYLHFPFSMIITSLFFFLTLSLP